MTYCFVAVSFIFKTRITTPLVGENSGDSQVVCLNDIVQDFFGSPFDDKKSVFLGVFFGECWNSFSTSCLRRLRSMIVEFLSFTITPNRKNVDDIFGIYNLTHGVAFFNCSLSLACRLRHIFLFSLTVCTRSNFGDETDIKVLIFLV